MRKTAEMLEATHKRNSVDDWSDGWEDYCEESKPPYMKSYSIDDGYGIVGSGWKCLECGKHNWFQTFYEGDEVSCEACNTVHLADYDSE